MNTATIISRPNVSMMIVREAMKTFLGRDLTTNVKGQAEPLALFSLMVSMDEYSDSVLAQRFLQYTFLCVVNEWSVDTIRNIGQPFLEMLCFETKNVSIRTLFLSGTLADFVYLVKVGSTIGQQDDVLQLLNNIQKAIENEGLSRVFNDVIKEQRDGLFYLRRKE